MRINVDEQAISEPRIKRMARRIQRPHYEVLGRILPVWMLCYQRRSAIVSAIDIDIAADLDGFADLMVTEEMAETHEDGIYVRGVSDRIEFLERQVEKGKKSGEVRRAKSKGSTAPRTDVQHGFKSGSSHTGTNGRTSVEPRLDSGRTKSGTYSPDLDLDQAPDQDHRIFAGERDNAVETSGAALDALLSSETSPEPEPHRNGGLGSKAPHSRGHASTARNERPIPDPPVPALTTASVLMDYLLRNHPESKLARCTELQRENTLLSWAHDVRLMHEADHLEYGAIQAMIHWCQRDKFWSTVIISAGKLRDKWDQMAAQRKRPVLAAAGKGELTREEVEAKWAKEKAASRAETDRIAAKAAAVAAERAGVDPETTEPLDDGADSGEDDGDVG